MRTYAGSIPATPTTRAYSSVEEQTHSASRTCADDSLIASNYWRHSSGTRLGASSPAKPTFTIRSGITGSTPVVSSEMWSSGKTPDDTNTRFANSRARLLYCPCISARSVLDCLTGGVVRALTGEAYTLSVAGSNPAAPTTSGRSSLGRALAILLRELARTTRFASYHFVELIGDAPSDDDGMPR